MEDQVTWGRVISIAWLILWRGFVGSAIIGATFGFIIGLVMGLAGAVLKNPMITSLIPWVTTTVGAAMGFGWFLIVVRMALGKSYRDFRLVVTPAAKVGL